MNTSFFSQIPRAYHQLMELFTTAERKQFVWVCVATTIMSFVQSLSLLLLVPFVSLVMNGGKILTGGKFEWVHKLLGSPEPVWFIFILAVMLCMIIIVANLFALYSIRLTSKFVWDHHRRLTVELVSAYLSLPYYEILSKNSADLSKNILSETQVFTTQVVLPLVKFITSTILVAVLIATLLVLSPLFTLVALGIVGGGYVFLYLLLNGRIKQYGKVRIKKNKILYVRVLDALQGMKEIKIFNAESYFLRMIDGHSKAFTQVKANYQVVSSAPRYIIEILAFIGGVGLLVFLFILEIDMQTLLPVAVLFISAGYKLIPALQVVFDSFASFRFNKPTLDLITRDMKLLNNNQKVDTTNSLESIQLQRYIQFNSVSFAYNEVDGPILENISYTIQKGDTVAIVGETGSGKSTFVSILLGLLQPSQGTVTIDDIELTQERVPAWLRTVGYVPQYIFLVDDTIARNIAFGVADDDIDMDRVREVCNTAQIGTFIDSLPAAYDTEVGEKGVRLSGGQRQRLGIARALYRNPEVLVLDEATSALDDDTAYSIVQALSTLAGVKCITLIYITHNPNILRNINVVNISIQRLNQHS